MSKTIKLKYNGSWCTIKDATPETLRYLEVKLSYKDKQAEYMNRRNTWSNKETTVCLLNKNKFYTGLLPRVKATLDSMKQPYTMTKSIKAAQPTPQEIPDWIYEHQRKIIDTALQARRCIIQSPTGSGKTIAMTMFMKQFPNEKILVTVPSKDLLAQTHKVLETHLGEEVGKVGGGKKDWKRVTVGIINTLSKVAKEDEEIFKQIQILVCDEVHRVGHNFYRDICEILDNTDYRVGFSATAWRERGDGLVLEGLIGPIAMSITEDYLVKKKILVKPLYYQIPFTSPDRIYSKYNHKYKAYMTPNGKPERDEVYYSCIVNCKARNELIVDLAAAYYNSNPKLPILVLVEILKQGDILQDLFKSRHNLDVRFIHGKCPSKERKQYLEDLKELKIPLSIASRILNEGQDVPALGVGILAGGGGSASKVIQQVGRFVRSYPEKDTAVIIDFNDSDQYYLNSNSKKRRDIIQQRYPNSYKSIKEESIMIKLSDGLTSFQKSK